MDFDYAIFAEGVGGYAVERGWLMQTDADRSYQGVMNTKPLLSVSQGWTPSAIQTSCP
jgi:hypothetical protein